MDFPEMTDERIKSFLEVVVPCKTETEFDRACIHFFRKDLNKTPAHQRGNLMLRRTVWRLHDYHPEHEAPWRTGLGWTWAEGRMLELAFGDEHKKTRESEVRVPPTVKYIARLIYRTPAEVKAEVDRRANEKYGVRGFDL